MVFDKKAGDGDAPFNMAMMFYIRLNQLIEKKDNAFIDDDMNTYYACLQAMFNNIYFQIQDEKNVESIENDLLKATNILSASPPQDKQLRMQMEPLNFFRVRTVLLQIDRQLMVLMDKKKMIFPRMELNHGLDKLRAKMGLKK